MKGLPVRTPVRRPCRLACPPTIAILVSVLSPLTAAAIEVTVEKTGTDEVTVRYELAEPARELLFIVDAPSTRADYWQVDPSFELLGDRIVSRVAFTEVAARLQPNDRFMDRVYASLFSIDDSTAVVNLDYIRPKGSPASTTVSVRNAYDPHQGACVRSYAVNGAASARHPDRTGRYVLLSDSFEACVAQVEKSKGGILFSSEMPPFIEDAVVRALQPVYTELQERFAYTPEPEPTVFLSWNPAAENDTYQGDAGWHTAISLRFYGDAWGSPDSRAATQAMSFLAHELVHAWIGRLARLESAGERSSDWLHEGAAEYIGMLALAGRGHVTRDYFKEQIGSRFTACVRDLGARSLMTDHGAERGRVIYDCGVLTQFVYDTVARAESGGERTVVDLWRELINASLEDGAGTIEAGAFIDRYAKAKDLLSGVLYGPETDGAAIATALESFGVETSVRPSIDLHALAPKILYHFLYADCTSGPVGFWMREDHLELDANDSCASIPAGFRVRRIEDVDVLERPGDAYAAAALACAGSGTLRLGGRTTDEPVLTLRCPGPLPARPLEIEVRAMPFL